MKKIFYSLAAIIASFPFVLVARAASISMSIPGTNSDSSSTSPAAFVANFYQFALMIAGVLAFGIVVYGGIKYMASSGNPSGQSDAKEWIEAALIGLLLLVGAYFVLNIVNPQLTTLGLPTLQTVNVQSTAPSCAGLTCPTGYVPTTIGGPGTTQPTATCVCENANGTQGCGGGVAGTDPNSCGAGNTCVETKTSPVTYACQPSAQFDCGIPPTHDGKCGNPQQQCEPYNTILVNGVKTNVWECQTI